MTWIRHLGRFVVTCLVIYLLARVVPQFSIGGIMYVLALAIAIAIFSSSIEQLWRKSLTPFIRGLIGFFVSFMILSLAFSMMNSWVKTILASSLAAIAIGVNDIFMPYRFSWFSRRNRK